MPDQPLKPAVSRIHLFADSNPPADNGHGHKIIASTLVRPSVEKKSHFERRSDVHV